MITIQVNPYIADHIITAQPSIVDRIINIAPNIGSVIYREHEAFSGPYEYTPSSEEQTVPIAYLMASQDIKINPIPNNYGLITWDGSTITVS